ncbi:MAG: isopentenyl transferase family protein, partial [Bacteroidia bacterium]
MAGPTAVGKTALSVELAKYYNTVILSADSRQFYRELNIGTAKPSEEQLNAVKHYFINNKSINELYGAGHYEKDAIELLDELFKEHD